MKQLLLKIRTTLNQMFDSMETLNQMDQMETLDQTFDLNHQGERTRIDIA